VLTNVHFLYKVQPHFIENVIWSRLPLDNKATKDSI